MDMERPLSIDSSIAEPDDTEVSFSGSTEASILTSSPVALVLRSMASWDVCGAKEATGECGLLSRCGDTDGGFSNSPVWDEESSIAVRFSAAGSDESWTETEETVATGVSFGLQGEPYP